MGALHSSPPDGCSECCPALGKLTWDQSGILSSGADKEIFAGKIGTQRVVVCVARATRNNVSRERIASEINVLRKLGRHPYIIKMLKYRLYGQKPYLVLEQVKPIGYDLSKLQNQYAWVYQTVPSALTAHLYRQLVSALRHMHGRKVLHRDLKTDNVLVTERHEVRLIDFGIACEIGLRQCLQAGYLAPEICEGVEPLGPEVDCWGLGLMLHQMYQNKWDLVDFRGGSPKLRPGYPSNKFRMETSMAAAMRGLLNVDRYLRWTLDDLQGSQWLGSEEKEQSEGKSSWIQPQKIFQKDVRLYLRYFKQGAPLTAYAGCVDKDSGIVGKTLGESGFFGATVLLMADKDGLQNTMPGRDTQVQRGDWIFFGVPQDERMDEVVKNIKTALFPTLNTSASAHDTSKRGKLLAFTLEFDCFTFPDHIPSGSYIGPMPQAVRNISQTSLNRESFSQGQTKDQPETPTMPLALNMRKEFRINLAGVQHEGSSEPIWFPGPNVQVRPGDRGLVVRRPCEDGSTKPTVSDSELQALMDESAFRDRCEDWRAERQRRNSTNSATTPKWSVGSSVRSFMSRYGADKSGADNASLNRRTSCPAY